MKNEKKEKKLIYLCDSRMKELNDYERQHGKISYKTLLKYYDIYNNMVLCNKIGELDNSLYDNIETGSLTYTDDDGNEYYDDVYQYFIIDFAPWMLDDIKEKYSDELIITYSDLLECYVLLVDHFGTSWDYVLTDIEFTDDWETFDKWEKEKEAQYE